MRWVPKEIYIEDTNTTKYIPVFPLWPKEVGRTPTHRGQKRWLEFGLIQKEIVPGETRQTGFSSYPVTKETWFDMVDLTFPQKMKALGIAARNILLVVVGLAWIAYFTATH